MITSDGKEIISKYLLGQVPSYATHVSIGCGATPLDANDLEPANLEAKKYMDFEMVRVPISSKGFVDASEYYGVEQKQLTSNVATLELSENHSIIPGETIIVNGIDNIFNGEYRVLSVTSDTVSYSRIYQDVSPSPVSSEGSLVVSRTKISLTAEIPPESRYEITEVGVWSAGNNSLTTSFDSRILFNFSDGWQEHGVAISSPELLSDIGGGGADIENTDDLVFYVNTNDPIFQINVRKERKEGPRHLNKSLLVRGDMSEITYESLDGDWSASGTHVHLNGINLDISQNNASDIFKLALCMIDRETVLTSYDIDNVKVMMEFYANEVNVDSGYAKAQIYIPGTYLENNRYYVSDFSISQNIDPNNQSADTALPYMRFYTSPDFSSSDVRVVRIFVSIEKNDETLSSDHYLCFDGFRIENTTINPVYKMSGYSVVRTDNGYPIIKFANTNNYIDFRFNIGVA
jgi:hypothetical protein